MDISNNLEINHRTASQITISGFDFKVFPVDINRYTHSYRFKRSQTKYTAK